MTCPNASALRSPDLDEFLYAEVGIQENGMPLTVLSLLARAGADPWGEAERLSIVSNRAAVSSMTAAINSLPAFGGNKSDVTEVAARLVARLPAHAPQKQCDVEVMYYFEAFPVWKLATIAYATIGLVLVIALAMDLAPRI